MNTLGASMNPSRTHYLCDPYDPEVDAGWAGVGERASLPPLDPESGEVGPA